MREKMASWRAQLMGPGSEQRGEVGPALFLEKGCAGQQWAEERGMRGCGCSPAGRGLGPVQQGVTPWQH